jgi:hypothetical protein
MWIARAVQTTIMLSFQCACMLCASLQRQLGGEHTAPTMLKVSLTQEPATALAMRQAKISTHTCAGGL